MMHTSSHAGIVNFYIALVCGDTLDGRRLHLDSWRLRDDGDLTFVEGPESFWSDMGWLEQLLRMLMLMLMLMLMADADADDHGISESIVPTGDCMTTCNKCGGIIRGVVVRHAGAFFHVGCAPR
jgi:hypothetical protein